MKRTLAVVTLGAELGDLAFELGVVLMKTRPMIHVPDVGQFMTEDRKEPADRQKLARGLAENELDDFAGIPISSCENAVVRVLFERIDLCS